MLEFVKAEIVQMNYSRFGDVSLHLIQMKVKKGGTTACCGMFGVKQGFLCQIQGRNRREVEVLQLTLRLPQNLFLHVQ